MIDIRKEAKKTIYPSPPKITISKNNSQDVLSAEKLSNKKGLLNKKKLKGKESGNEADNDSDADYRSDYKFSESAKNLNDKHIQSVVDIKPKVEEVISEESSEYNDEIHNLFDDDDDETSFDACNAVAVV